MIHRLRMLRASAERVHRLAMEADRSAVRARAGRGTRYEDLMTQWATEDLERLREATRRHTVRIDGVVSDYAEGGI